MKLTIRPRAAARATSVVLLSGAAAVALAPTAGAAERRPIDQAADVVAQLIYPDPEGGMNDWTAEERVDGWLGYKSLPGGPFGHWGPGPEAVGYFGIVGAVIGGPPLPGSPHPVGGQSSPVSEFVTALGDLSGPAEVSTPSAVSATKDSAADDPVGDLLAAAAGLVFADEGEEWTTEEPQTFPVYPPESEDPPRK